MGLCKICQQHPDYESCPVANQPPSSSSSHGLQPTMAPGPPGGTYDSGGSALTVTPGMTYSPPLYGAHAGTPNGYPTGNMSFQAPPQPGCPGCSQGFLAVFGDSGQVFRCGGCYEVFGICKTCGNWLVNDPLTDGWNCLGCPVRLQPTGRTIHNATGRNVETGGFSLKFLAMSSRDLNTFLGKSDLSLVLKTAALEEQDQRQRILTHGQKKLSRRGAIVCQPDLDVIDVARAMFGAMIAESLLPDGGTFTVAKGSDSFYYATFSGQKFKEEGYIHRLKWGSFFGEALCQMPKLAVQPQRYTDYVEIQLKSMNSAATASRKARKTSHRGGRETLNEACAEPKLLAVVDQGVKIQAEITLWIGKASPNPYPMDNGWTGLGSPMMPCQACSELLNDYVTQKAKGGPLTFSLTGGGRRK